MKGLKSVVDGLKELYGPHHQRAQVTPSNGMEELVVHFKRENQTSIKLACSLLTYPQMLWYGDVDDDSIPEEIMEWLKGQSEENVAFDVVIRKLIIRLCEHFGESLTDDLKAVPPRPGSSIELMELGCPIDQKEDEEETEEEMSDDDSDVEIHLETGTVSLDSDVNARRLGQPNGAGDSEQRGVEKWRKIQNKMRGASNSSTAASMRLMKDMKELYTAKSVQEGQLVLDIDENNIYTWGVSIMKVDEDSKLAGDLAQMPAKLECPGKIDLSIEFTPNYPFDPPKVRVVSPCIKGGYVLRGGAICMELLTKDGWCSTYTIEKVVQQISATLVQGDARVDFTRNASSSYSKQQADVTFASIERFHKRSGWSRSQKLKG